MARSRVWPVLTLLLLAPLLGESLSTATPPLEILVWGPVSLIPLYGCGALLCRELVRRYRLGTPGLILLATAYAVYEEALVDGYWFDTAFAEKVGVDGYSRVWDTSLLLATHLTSFHVVVSVGASIVIVERLFHAHRDEPWLRRRWLPVPVLAFGSALFVTWETYERGPVGPVLVSAGLFVLLIAAAFLVPRWRRTPHETAPHETAGHETAGHETAGQETAPPDTGAPERRPRRRLAGFLAAGCALSHFALVYTIPYFGLPWPAGLLLALAPVALGVWLVPRLSVGSALPGITGVLAECSLVSGVVGLGGRYDFTLFALALGILLWWLNRQENNEEQRSAGPSRPWMRSDPHRCRRQT